MLLIWDVSHLSCRKRGIPTFKKAWGFLSAQNSFCKFLCALCVLSFLIKSHYLWEFTHSFHLLRNAQKNSITLHINSFTKINILYKERKKQKPWEFLVLPNGSVVWFCILNFRKYPWFKLTHFSYKWMKCWIQLMKAAFHRQKKWFLCLLCHVY